MAEKTALMDQSMMASSGIDLACPECGISMFKKQSGGSNTTYSCLTDGCSCNGQKMCIDPTESATMMMEDAEDTTEGSGSVSEMAD